MSAMELNAPVDFAIVTALSVERNAVLERLAQVTPVQEPEDPYTYYLGEVEIPGGEAYRVVLMMLLDPGNVETASATTRLIQRWLPQHILMVGIAGGIERAPVHVPIKVTRC